MLILRRSSRRRSRAASIAVLSFVALLPPPSLRRPSFSFFFFCFCVCFFFFFFFLLLLLLPERLVSYLVSRGSHQTFDRVRICSAPRLLREFPQTPIHQERSVFLMMLVRRRHCYTWKFTNCRRI